MQVEPAGGGADPGRQGDQLPADGGGGGSGVTGRGEGAGGAGEVERDRCKDSPGGVGGEPPERQVRQSAALEVVDYLFDDRVVAVGCFGIEYPES